MACLEEPTKGWGLEKQCGGRTHGGDSRVRVWSGGGIWGIRHVIVGYARAAMGSAEDSKS